MNKIMVIIIVAALLVGVGFYTGFLPSSITGFEHNSSPTTTSFKVRDITGNTDYELLKHKGYICSYLNQGFSEEITAQGSYTLGLTVTGAVYSYKYLVYLKKDIFSEYELVSSPEATSTYLEGLNIEEQDTANVIHLGGGLMNARDYSFKILGNDYTNGFIKVEFWLKISDLFPITTKWVLLSVDEATLFEGKGGMWLPTGTDGRPISTFEIGEDMKIHIITGHGGYRQQDGSIIPFDTWKIELNYPQDYKDGAVYKTAWRDDNTNNYWLIPVTENMAEIGMDSNYPWTISLYNVLSPKGSLQAYTVDFVAYCPDDVSFTAPIQSEIDKPVNVKFSALPNVESQREIDFFTYSVIYGDYRTLMPPVDDPAHGNWITYSTNIDASPEGSAYVATISFVPTRDGWVSIFAMPKDSGGYTSRVATLWTMNIYKTGNKPDDSAVADVVGEHDYAGGYSQGRMPWDPNAGNWRQEEEDNALMLIIAFIIIIMFLLLAFLIPIRSPIIRLVIILVGVIIAVYVYFFIELSMPF